MCDTFLEFSAEGDSGIPTDMLKNHVDRISHQGSLAIRELSAVKKQWSIKPDNLIYFINLSYNDSNFIGRLNTLHIK